MSLADIKKLMATLVPKPTADYTLDTDPVHRNTNEDDIAVSVPGLAHRFQLAVESHPHIWPHNA